MKVKVKGLVFVGFAAAVFAQSAFATIAPNENDKKVVTSKYYVDSTFQEEEDKVTTGNIGTIAGDNNDPWASDTLYPSMKVVKSAISALAPAVGSNATDYVDFTESGDTFTVNFDNAPATAAADLTGYDATNAPNGAALTSPNDKKLVTAGAVNSMILREDTNGTTINSSSTNGTVPTSKNVYDFVTTQGSNKQRKLGSTETGLYVGAYSATDAETWKALETVATADQATTDYVTIKENNGVYQVNIPTAQIADSIATDSSAKLVTENAVYDLVAREGTGAVTTINGTSPSDSLVPTVKNVYDFVDGNYQVKATGTTVQVGYDGTWHTLGGDNYITVGDNGTASSVTLGNFAAAADLYASVDTNDGKLVTAGLVRNMRDTTLEATGESDQTIPTSKAVVDYVNGQFVLGSNPCNADTSAGHYCALVAHYDATAGGAVYEWTVMAPQN